MTLLTLKEPKQITRLQFEGCVIFHHHLTFKERFWNRNKDYGVVYFGLKFKVITQYFL